jgi:putative membrane protein
MNAAGSSILWVEAFHIVFVAGWFSGLFCLPRIFVNLATVSPDSHAERERLLLMARRLYRVTNLLMVAAIVLGLWLWFGWGAARFAGRYWLHVKLLLVAGAIGYQHACRAHLRRFERIANTRTARWFFGFGAVGAVLFAAIVVLAVVRPF